MFPEDPRNEQPTEAAESAMTESTDKPLQRMNYPFSTAVKKNISNGTICEQSVQVEWVQYECHEAKIIGGKEAIFLKLASYLCEAYLLS